MNRVLSIVVVLLVVVNIFLSIALFKEIAQPLYIEEEPEVVEVEPPELAEIQFARLEYYKSQARYYNLMSIDYEDNLRERGLIE